MRFFRSTDLLASHLLHSSCLKCFKSFRLSRIPLGKAVKKMPKIDLKTQGPFNQNIKGQNPGQKRPLHPIKGPPAKVMKRAETGVQGKAMYQANLNFQKPAKGVFIENNPITYTSQCKGKYVPPSLRPKKAAQNVAPKLIGNKPNTNAPKEKASVATEKPTVTQATIEKGPALKEKEAPKEVKDTTKLVVEEKKPSEQKRISEIKVLSVAQINEQTDIEVSQVIQTDEQDTSSGGHSELNELMSNILKEELRDIMDKVWGCLLDQPDTAPDVVAADMMRHEVAPHIGTTIGLNVTKRLLNVFNPMFAKIQFSCRPENGCITAFLQKYNIKNFKRIDSEEYTFAAQIEDVADFDALCYTEGLKCGSADLKITPCYKYTQCPAKLKLNLEEDDETNLSDDFIFDDEDNEPIFTDSVKTDKQVVQDQEKAPVNVENKANDKNKENQTKTTAEVKKSNITVTDSSSKNDIRKVTNSKMNTVPETAKENEDKDKTSQIDIHKVTNSKLISTPESTKESVNEKKTSQNDIHKVTNSKAISLPESTKESLDKEKTSQNNKADVSPKKLSMNTFEVIDEAYEDEDEVDDANISDLLAGGVVLDECGSDD